MNYNVIIDDISRDEWEQYASGFADYSIYQTWPYQQVRAEMDDQQISRFIIKNENRRVETMGQVRIKYIKLLGLKIGYVQWGPLIRQKDGSFTALNKVFSLLRKVYLGEKVNILRVVPNIWDNKTGRVISRAIENCGFDRVKNFKPYHTMVLPLACSEDELSKGLHQSWRRQLRKAQRAILETAKGDGPESFKIMERLYLDTMRRKNIKGLIPQTFTRTQNLLSLEEKMELILIKKNDQCISAHLTSNLGNTAVFLLGGSNLNGLEFRASYLAWWNAVSLSNRLGIKMYDVGGVNFERNPTVSRFKAGIGAKEVFYIGAFEACTNLVVKKMWQAIEKAHIFISGKD